MNSRSPQILYHYCSLETFFSIVKSSSIWLSDVKKSNDSQEMKWLRHKYYYYILEKYNETNDKNIKSICEIILSMATKDDFKECPAWLLPACGKTDEQMFDIFNSLRVYTFCLSQQFDSLGQWRGYADGGQGVAIGFSKSYLNAVKGRGLLCPISNFIFGNISYKTEFTSLFDSIFSMHNQTNVAEFVFKNLQDITHISALFKSPSFKEEKEWRIVCSMSDYGLTKEMLHFENFDMVSTPAFKKKFSTPRIDYCIKNSNIIPHVELKFNDMSKAVKSIVLGPKCNATEKDIYHLLLNLGWDSKTLESDIEIVRSESSYR